jgi:ABC-type molybdate transport system substrate-binding protein
MFTVAVVLFILWLLGFFAFHVTSVLIHVLLAASLVSAAAGFIRRGSNRSPKA